MVLCEADGLQEETGERDVDAGHAGDDAVDRADHRRGPALLPGADGEAQTREADPGVEDHQHAQQHHQPALIEAAQHLDAQEDRGDGGQEERPKAAEQGEEGVAVDGLEDIGEENRDQHHRHRRRQVEKEGQHDQRNGRQAKADDPLDRSGDEEDGGHQNQGLRVRHGAMLDWGPRVPKEGKPPGNSALEALKPLVPSQNGANCW